jgi:hypothetical protein
VEGPTTTKVKDGVSNNTKKDRKTAWHCVLYELAVRVTGAITVLPGPNVMAPEPRLILVPAASVELLNTTAPVVPEVVTMALHVTPAPAVSVHALGTTTLPLTVTVEGEERENALARSTSEDRLRVPTEASEPDSEPLRSSEPLDADSSRLVVWQG